ncbi:MAG TPA: YqiA/YcfP family alpha/beta fold hydrolase [Thermoanaerobaculia bacterium]|nr:YqiA/YcfP family alpha/beta fold hydrolase [Thermoanaerobaculia bacterium]
MTRTILYFHGFASSPASAKIALLRPMLAPDVELITPDLNVPSFERLDWNAIVDYAKTFENYDVIAGSSMGALVALSIARPHIPLVLIAPALGIADRWRTMLPDGDPIPVFHHTRNEKVPVHRKFFEQMFRVRIDEHAPPSRVTVIMGRNDESVPYQLVEQTWNNWKPDLVEGSKFIEIAEGDHGLTAHAGLIARELRGFTT